MDYNNIRALFWLEALEIHHFAGIVSRYPKVSALQFSLYIVSYVLVKLLC